MSGKHILIVGSGGREHALAWRLAGEPGAGRVTCAPGNPLMADVADVRDDVPLGDIEGLVGLAQRLRTDLVIVGPEAPLVAGLADRLAGAGIACFGPASGAARLEGSKSFAREVCQAAGVPTAAGRSFDDPGAAADYAAALGGRVVIKADGLAAGKGVTVCSGLEEATAAIREALVERRFGEAGSRVVVEERLEGQEASVIAVCDERTALLLPAARDHKRLAAGDAGPNTGGMGAFSPVPEIDAAGLREIGRRIHRPVLGEMARRGLTFRGALFAGLMLTRDGPRVLEFNVRLGDPETQALMPRLASPLLPLLAGAAAGTLSEAAAAAGIEDGLVPTLPGATVALTLAAAGYPDSPRAGDAVAGLAQAKSSALIFGAGIGRDHSNGDLVTSGGRVLTVVGQGADTAAAADAAYEAAARISFDGCQLRTDIGRPAVAVGAGA